MTDSINLTVAQVQALVKLTAGGDQTDEFIITQIEDDVIAVEEIASDTGLTAYVDAHGLVSGGDV